MKTTPRMIRAELKKRGLPYDIWKNSQCWYVTGGNSNMWQSQSLNTYTFHGISAWDWVNEIQELEKKNQVNP
jgi:hypothetical protein